MPLPHGNRAAARAALPATVVALGVVSLLTDLSSEMIYPLLPLFLTTVLGAGPQALGLIEGVAESTASLVKVASGVWSDRTARRKPLVVGGYSLAGAMRPLIGLAQAWPTVLLLRFADRLGKGLRTSPRDAMIADATPLARRGEAFGVQRALDHLGAVLGPLAAAALLTLAGLSLRAVFVLAIVPAVAVVVVLLAFLRETPHGNPAAAPRLAGSWGELGRPAHVLLAAVFLFTLGNSSDAFLLLRLSEAGASPAGVALAWSGFHVVKTASAYLAGRWSDRVGRRSLVIAGWAFYAAVYLAFAVASSRTAVVAIFLAYGLYYGLTEPVERAWLADLVPERLRGTAFGLYHGAIGLAALPASVLFGLLWQRVAPAAAFATGAALAGAAALLLLRVPARRDEPG